MTGLSPEMLDSLFARETGEVYVQLLTIEQSDLDAPLRVCGDPKEVLSNAARGIISNGLEYVYFPFEFVPPGESDEQFSLATLRIDGTTREILFAVRQMRGPAEITVQLVRASEPDVVEMLLPPLTLRNIVAVDTIEGQLYSDQYDTEPFPEGRFSPSSFPGLFPGTE